MFILFYYLTCWLFYPVFDRDFGDNNTGKGEPCFTKELIKLAVINAVKQLFGEVRIYI